MAWKHDELAADLAAYLTSPERMVWTDMQLGPSGSPRPDVYTLEKSYSKPLPTAFEVKISRSDLRSDTTSGKWQSYLKFAGSVTFAVPDGLCTVADIPDGCGLIVRKDAVWRYARRPTRQAVTPPFSACMKLLIDGVDRRFVGREPTPRRADLWREQEAVRKKFGSAVAIVAKDIARAQIRLDEMQARADSEWARVEQIVEARKAALLKQVDDERAQWDAIRTEVLAWLGLDGPAQSTVWAVKREIARLKAECNADERVSTAEARVSQVRSSVARLLDSLPAPAPTPLPPHLLQEPA